MAGIAILNDYGYFNFCSIYIEFHPFRVNKTRKMSVIFAGLKSKFEAFLRRFSMQFYIYSANKYNYLTV